MLEVDSGEEIGEGKDVMNSSSGMSEEEGAAEVGEGKDVGNSSSSMSEEEGAAEMGEGKNRLDIDVLLEVESQIAGKHVVRQVCYLNVMYRIM